jgi:ribosomal protein L44E
MAKEIDKYKKSAVFAPLKQFCYFGKEHDYIEVTEWKNGEGFDVEINGRKTERFQLTWGEFDALKKLVKQLKKQ